MLVKDLVEQRSRFTKAAWINFIERSNMERASAIHVTSELEKAELMRFKWQLPHVAMIPNGVDELADVARTELSGDVKEIASVQPLVLFLGRISWKKGLDRLLNAFAVTRVGRLAIVGTDDEGLVSQLRRLAEKLQIGDRVRFLPRMVLGSDKEHLFKSAQLFVLSSYSENFGNTVVEAMRRALPVLVTPEVGAAEIVRNAGGGLIVEGDPEEFGKAISRMLADPALARAMGEAGKHYVLRHYSWSSVASQMEALYESLTAAHLGRT
jgi:glycosyltransferase involved in cell wall biosynthesis